MMTSISSLSSSILKASSNSSRAAVGTSFSQTLAAATPISGVAVAVFDKAKSLSSSTPADTFDFDFSFTNVNHTQEEWKAHLAEGARRVSEMQGLPEGQYDFSRMSAKQAQVVMGDLTANHGATYEDTCALSGFILDNTNLQGSTPVYSDTPMNALAHIMKQQASINGSAYGVPTESLKYLMGVQGGALSMELDRAIYDAIGLSLNADEN